MYTGAQLVLEICAGHRARVMQGRLPQTGHGSLARPKNYLPETCRIDFARPTLQVPTILFAA